MRSFTLVSAVLIASCASVAPAEIALQIVRIDNTAGNAEIPGFSDTHVTFDLQVVVTGADDWTAIAAEANALNSLTFYQHEFGYMDGTPPKQTFFGSFPALEFDSYWSAAAVIGPGESGIAPWFGDVPIQTDTELQAMWYDTVDTGDGIFTLARYTFANVTPDDVFLGTVSGNATARNTGGDLIQFHFDFIVPTPASIAPMLLGLALVRRRIG